LHHGYLPHRVQSTMCSYSLGHYSYSLGHYNHARGDNFTIAQILLTVGEQTSTRRRAVQRRCGGPRATPADP